MNLFNRFGSHVDGRAAVQNIRGAHALNPEPHLIRAAAADEHLRGSCSGVDSLDDHAGLCGNRCHGAAGRDFVEELLVDNAHRVRGTLIHQRPFSDNFNGSDGHSLGWKLEIRVQCQVVVDPKVRERDGLKPDVARFERVGSCRYVQDHELAGNVRRRPHLGPDDNNVCPYEWFSCSCVRYLPPDLAGGKDQEGNEGRNEQSQIELTLHVVPPSL